MLKETKKLVNVIELPYHAHIHGLIHDGWLRAWPHT
jgi:hypothetical protein